MDPELIAYLDQRFGETNKQIAALRQETAVHIVRVVEAIRQTRDEVDSLRGDIRVIAEGIVSLEEKMASFRRQVTGEIADVRNLIQPAYSALDDRLTLLEAWRERKERDPLEVIRERFGLGKVTLGG